MVYKSNVRYHTAIFIIAVLVLLTGTPILQAQTKQILAWQDDLYYMMGVSDANLPSNRDGIEQIRKGVELWIEMHPSTKIEFPAAPAKPWGAGELRNQVNILSKAVEDILKSDPARPFELGTTAVSVTAEASPLSPVTESIDRKDMQDLDATTVASALDYLPGLSLDKSANRNEVRIHLRGFNSIGQIPLYLDGIPIQVPYDGTLDLERFLTNDLAEIQVAKGYSSPLLGANNLGGSINLVTRQPEKKFESDALIGTGSGELFRTALQLGTKWEKFYLQGSADYQQQEFIPLSGDFPVPSPNQENYELNHSNKQDAKYNARFAWTPKGRNQYVFSYTNQKGEKNQPLYTGPSGYARNWDWPYWNKYSYYFISNTESGETGSFRFRGYYDQFKNGLRGYNRTRTFETFYSKYDDHTGGFSSEFTTRIIPRNTASASFTFKDDTHKSTDLGEPTLLDRAQTFSIGFQDVLVVTERLRATFGFSADHLKGLQAQNVDGGILVALNCEADPENTSFRGCLPNGWTYNPQVSASYNLSGRDTLFITFADRGRFPLLKELYSYGLESRLPNPDLKAERSRNWNIGYSHVFPYKTLAQVEYFHNTIRDGINDVMVPDPDNLCPEGEGLCEQWANVSKEAHQGFEISVKSQPITRVNLDASYSYISRKIDWDPYELGADPAYMILYALPKHKVVVNGAVILPRQILALATLRFEGGLNVQDQSYRSDPPPPYSVSNTVMDLGIVVPIFGGLSAQSGIKNLFDRYYYYTPGYPEAGRTWYFNLRHRY